MELVRTQKPERAGGGPQPEAQGRTEREKNMEDQFASLRGKRVSAQQKYKRLRAEGAHPGEIDEARRQWARFAKKELAVEVALFEYKDELDRA